ncbi:MAG: hypothetical protein ABR600_10810 [Actinomycetota bacterium]
MRKRIVYGVVSAAVAALTTGVVLAGAATASSQGTIHVRTFSQGESFIDNAATGPSPGDVLVVRDVWKNDEGHVVGHGRLVCTVTYVAGNEDIQLQCLLTGHTSGGDLTAQGLFTEPGRRPHHPTVFWAVTGGTGSFAGATGSVRVHEVSEEESDVTFTLSTP